MSLKKKNILRVKQATDKVKLSRTTLYSKLNPDSPYYDPNFPKPIKLSERSMGFLECELDQWIFDKAAARGTDTIKVNTACHAARDARNARKKAKGA